MISLKMILVATDLSDSGRAVLAQGRTLARTFDAALHVLTVVTEPLHETWTGYVPGPELVAAIERAQVDAREQLERLVPREDPRNCPITLATAWGEPADEIVAYARRHHAGLIVCGTHGRSGLSHVLTASVAERVVRLAPCPVLTVRAVEAAADAA